MKNILHGNYGKPKGEKSKNRDFARSLKQSGMTYAKIGERMGISRQRAQQLVAPSGLQKRELIEKLGGVCSACGKSGIKLDLHHEDYSKPPELLLCVSCHREKHPRAGVGNSTSHHIKSNTEVDALVEAHAEYHGFDSYSAALRSIVLEWRRMKATLSTSPKRKTQAEQG